MKKLLEENETQIVNDAGHPPALHQTIRRILLLKIQLNICILERPSYTDKYLHYFWKKKLKSNMNAPLRHLTYPLSGNNPTRQIIHVGT